MIDRDEYPHQDHKSENEQRRVEQDLRIAEFAQRRRIGLPQRRCSMAKRLRIGKSRILAGMALWMSRKGKSILA